MSVVVDGEAVEIPNTPETGAASSTAVAVLDAAQSGAIIRAEEPREILRKAQEIAKPLAELIESAGLAVALDKRNPHRKHVEVGGWQATGTMLGALGGQPLHAETVWTRRIVDADGALQRTKYTAVVKRYHPKSKGGGLREEITYQVDGHDWEACVEVKTPGGVTVGRAEAMVSRAENTWAQRDDYALRSMAETRAESRAWRKAIGWIVHLAGYNPTPAEEMGHTPGADTQDAAPAGPLFGPAAPDELVGKARRALGFLLEAPADSPAVTGVLERLTAEADGYLPRVSVRAVGIAAAAVKDARATRPAEESVDATDPVDEHAAWAAQASDAALLAVASADADADPARVASAKAEVDRRLPDDPRQAAGSVALPSLPKDPGKATGVLRAAGCVCKDPLAAGSEEPVLDDLCPIESHGISF